MEDQTKKENKYSWIYFAIFWSFFMTLIMGVGEPLYKRETIAVNSVLHQAMLWIPMGVLVGLLNRYLAQRTAKKKQQ